MLDKATSNVDLHSQARIRLDVAPAAGGTDGDRHRTTASTIRQAGRIVVLEHGRVAQQGTHDELIAAEGRYYELYRDWATQAAA